jgi:hypothetical protein
MTGEITLAASAASRGYEKVLAAHRAGYQDSDLTHAQQERSDRSTQESTQ